jgi:hypothetical protein
MTHPSQVTLPQSNCAPMSVLNTNSSPSSGKVNVPITSEVSDTNTTIQQDQTKSTKASESDSSCNWCDCPIIICCGNKQCNCDCDCDCDCCDD